MAFLTLLSPTVTGIGAAVRDALADTPGGPPDRACLDVPGAIAADGCDCGQLAVTVTRRYFANTFPAEATAADWTDQCGPPILCADITVQLLRCVPGPDDDGNPPTAELLTETAAIFDADAAAIRGALLCHLADLADEDRIVAWALQDEVPVGPDGGCGGTEHHLTVGMPYCNCPPGM